MPRRTYRKRMKKKRKYYRKSSSWLRQAGPGLVTSSPLGASFKMKSKYVATPISLNPGLGGTPSTHVFSANGIYDPDITGVGHQVLGFDQVMPMYDHYTVIGSRIKVIAANTTAQDNIYFIVSLSDSAIPSTDVTNTLENGHSRYKVLSVDQGDHGVETITMNFSPKRFFNTSVLDNRSLKGSITNNPSEQAYYHIMCAPLDGTTDAGVVRLSVEIEYIILFTEPKKLGSS